MPSPTDWDIGVPERPRDLPEVANSRWGAGRGCWTGSCLCSWARHHTARPCGPSGHQALTQVSSEGADGLQVGRYPGDTPGPGAGGAFRALSASGAGVWARPRPPEDLPSPHRHSDGAAPAPGAKKWLEWRKELELLSDAAYFGLTTLAGSTPGALGPGEPQPTPSPEDSGGGGPTAK